MSAIDPCMIYYTLYDKHTLKRATKVSAIDPCMIYYTLYDKHTLKRATQVSAIDPCMIYYTLYDKHTLKRATHVSAIDPCMIYCVIKQPLNTVDQKLHFKVLTITGLAVLIQGESFPTQTLM